MSIELELRIRGGADEISAILASLPDLSGEPAADPSNTEDLAFFIEELTQDGQRFVRAVALSSSRNEDLDRQELRSAWNVTNEIISGISGGVGVRWKQCFRRQDNPFKGKWRFEQGASHVFYRIDAGLAHQILTLLD